MAPSIQELGLAQLSVEDRLSIAEALWNSVINEAESSDLTPEQQAELARRLSDSIARPEAVTPWETIKARAFARAKK